jgi:hypothetical protein
MLRLDQEDIMIVALVSAGAAIAAAVLGVLVAQWVQRSRPVVLVDTLRLSPMPVPSGSMAQVKVNYELLHDIISYPIQLGEPQKQTLKEMPQEEYIPYLLSVQHDIRTQDELRLQHLSEIVENLCKYLSVGDFDRFVSFWAQEQNAIWPIIAEMVIIRKELSVKQLDADIRQDAKQAYELLQDEGQWAVILPGTLRIAFPRYEKSSATESVRNIERLVAHALAYQQRSVLEVLVNSLGSQHTVLLRLLKSLQHDVDAELRRYNRIHISGLIGNMGHSPFSVLSHGSLTINAKNYPESGEDSGTGHIETIKIPSDVTIDLVIGDNEGALAVRGGRTIGDAEGPLSVRAGQTIRFNAVTSHMMRSVQNYQGLIEAFSNGDRTCELHLEIVDVGRARVGKWTPAWTGAGGGRNIGTRLIHSKWLFRDSGKESVIHIDSPVGKFDDRSAELAGNIDALGDEIANLTTRIKELAAAISGTQGVNADGHHRPNAPSAYQVNTVDAEKSTGSQDES